MEEEDIRKMAGMHVKLRLCDDDFWYYGFLSLPEQGRVMLTSPKYTGRTFEIARIAEAAPVAPKYKVIGKGGDAL